MIQIIKGDTLNFLPTRTMLVIWLLKTRTLRKVKLRWEKLGVACMLLKVRVLTNLRGRRFKGIFSLSLHTSYILKNIHIKDFSFALECSIYYLPLLLLNYGLCTMTTLSLLCKPAILPSFGYHLCKYCIHNSLKLLTIKNIFLGTELFKLRFSTSIV